VHGTVQGVGFRPFVYRLAADLKLNGWVENTPQGVTIELEGNERRLSEFQNRLGREKPPLANICASEASILDARGLDGFNIRKSDAAGAHTATILPDIATCADCLRDILDPADRRYLYPFTNCTNCGPRFSIIKSLPYDRPNTSMSKFTMCAACRAEYDNPADRRFHAQPNACPDCGPHLQLWDERGHSLAERHRALLGAADALRQGGILALKGLGGFQLLVDARNDEAVQKLRSRKHREEKPLAVMAPSINDAETICIVSREESRLLSAPAAPIVLLRRRRENLELVCSGVAPANPYLGVMLPYTPLHHLLLRALGFPVVATSGNLSDEPICIDEAQVIERLEGIADVLLVHDRPVVRHVDDSVTRVVRGRETLLRRARGYAPLPVPGAHADLSVLAVGAHQKNAVAIATNGQVFVSQHIGDLATKQAVDAFERAAVDLPMLYHSNPRFVACDLHPDYCSTRHAHRLGKNVVAVQHHHAHVVSCMVENALDGRVLGVSWDGTGYGTDGTIWGGEFLHCNRSSFDRVAHLRRFRLPGGDLTSREPRRSAAGLLYEILGDDLFADTRLRPLKAFADHERRIIQSMLKQNFNCPVTSSMGRLFDGVASLIGLRQVVRNEGQAAMELEFRADEESSTHVYPVSLCDAIDEDLDRPSSETWVVDWEPIVRGVLIDLFDDAPIALIARKFHNTLVEIIVSVAHIVGEDRVVLTGGCFQNLLLADLAISRLEEEGFRPYWHQRVPPNDGGIALGQVVAAQQRITESSTCV
jgi:hydrogenase maturation protein HypF